MKKALSFALAAMLLVSAAAFPVSAEESYEGKAVILYTGNVRGNVDVYPAIAAAKAEYQSKGATVLLVDAGNYLQGSAAANTDRGLAIYTLMDAAGYDYAAMGLAEFSYTDATAGYPYHGNYTRYYTQKMLQEGTEALEYARDRAGENKAVLPAKEAARFQTLAGNVQVTEKGGEIYAFAGSAASRMAVFYGLTDPAAAALVQDGYIASIDAPRRYDARDASDILVCLSNAPGVSGGEYGDIVISAPTGGETVTGAYVIDLETKEITREEVDLSGSDEAVAALAAAAKAAAAPVVGMSEVILNGADSVNRNRESNLGDLTADALLWYAKNYIDGVDPSLPLVALQNGGNCDNFLYTGEITELDLLRALPFSPMGVGVLYVTGDALLETLEAADQTENSAGFAQAAGLTYTLDLNQDYDGGAAYGKYFEADSVNRVAITGVNDADFDPAATYAVVADNYVLSGNDTFYTLKNARDAGAVYINNGSGVLTRDIVALYIQRALGGVIGADYAGPQGRITVLKSAFTDVKPGAYYYDAVNWAAENGVTAGVSETEFSPDGACARAQLISFLWRLAGRPAASAEEKNPFADVNEESAYYTAILWAWENGIAGGVSETAFAPDRPVTRAEAVSFLYRWAGDGAAAAEKNPFDDVPEGRYYTQAVLWAYETGVTAGTGDRTFSPKQTCTRGQIATFLYKLKAEA